MGTHPKNPSRDVKTGRTLLDLVEDNRSLLSPAVAAKYGNKLPFLFKVLSIDKALSIQAHPNKKLAEQLHAKDPQNYPDDNHKPEMAIALTPFEGLCGFRPLDEIAHFLGTVAPLRELVGEDTAHEFIETARKNQAAETDEAVAENKGVLQKAFGALMSASEASISAQMEALVASAARDAATFAGSGVPSTPGTTLAELVRRLHGQFGADVGLFVLFFLNLVHLQPGEALFLRADDIHAYVAGDIMECMAASDNVVRAGLTPKFRDVAALVGMLTYDAAPIAAQKMHPAAYPFATLNRAAYSGGGAAVLYDPPIDEFAVVRTVLRGEGARATFDPVAGPSLVICTKGRGRIAVGPTSEEMGEGWVYFVGASAECLLESAGGPEDEFITFRAFCEVEDPSNGHHT